MQSEDTINEKRKKIFQLETDVTKLSRFVAETDEIKRENQLLQLRLDEKDLRVTDLEKDLEIAKSQIERME